jgi:hypothetical protein
MIDELQYRIGSVAITSIPPLFLPQSPQANVTVTYNDMITIIPPLYDNDTSMIIVGGSGDDNLTITYGIAAIFGDDAHGNMLPAIFLSL